MFINNIKHGLNPGRAINEKPKWFVIFTLITLSAFILSIYSYMKLQNDKNAADAKALVVENAINVYMDETKDYKLTFGRDKSVVSVDELLINLQKQIKINGYGFGPYLHSKSPEASNYLPVILFKTYGLQIDIDTDKNVRVQYYSKSSLNYVENAESAFKMSWIGKGLRLFGNLMFIQILLIFILWNLLCTVLVLLVSRIAGKCSNRRIIALTIVNFIASIVASVTFIFYIPVLTRYINSICVSICIIASLSVTLLFIINKFVLIPLLSDLCDKKRKVIKGKDDLPGNE